MYAQLSYKEYVGNSKLTISEIGCFDTADSNLLEKVGVHVDPPTLNTFYTQRKLYTYDLTDKANDDITWSTVTKYCPQLVVNQIGSSGFPNSDLAQVEFRYKDSRGDVVTHFCAVNSVSDHSIIDSVAIYAGPDTVAQFPGTGHGEGETTGNPGENQSTSAPMSAPAIVYTRFPEPMQLVTKPGAHAVNFESGTVVKDFEPDAPFEAVGKATFPDNVTYYMDNNSFGIADQTQRTPIMVGVKTDDLRAASKPETTGTASSTPLSTSSTAPSSPASADASQQKPVNSAVSWQETFEPIIKGDSKENPTPQTLGFPSVQVETS